MRTRLTLCLLALLLLPLWAQAQTFQPDLGNPLLRGLTAWWRGVPGATGGDRIFDLSLSQNHGTLTNMGYGTTSGWSPATHPGGYMQLNFDATDDYVETSVNPGTSVSTPLTLCSWVYVISDTGDTVLISNRIANNYTGVWWSPTDGAHPLKPALTLCSESGPCTNQEKVFSTNAIALNTWYHLCTTYDGSQTTAGIALYQNGVAVATTLATDTGFAAWTDRPWRLGANRNTTVGEILNGAMADTMVWNRALTAAEIAALYQQAVLGHPALQVASTRTFASLLQLFGAFFPFFR